MFAAAMTLRKQAFCDYYVSANQAIFFHTRNRGENGKASVSADATNTFPVHVAEGKMAEFQC